MPLPCVTVGYGSSCAPTGKLLVRLKRGNSALSVLQYPYYGSPGNLLSHGVIAACNLELLRNSCQKMPKCEHCRSEQVNKLFLLSSPLLTDCICHSKGVLESILQSKLLFSQLSYLTLKWMLANIFQVCVVKKSIECAEHQHDKVLNCPIKFVMLILHIRSLLAISFASFLEW